MIMICNVFLMLSSYNVYHANICSVAPDSKFIRGFSTDTRGKSHNIKVIVIHPLESMNI